MSNPVPSSTGRFCVVVTRQRGESDVLSQLLRSRDFEVIEAPVIEIRGMELGGEKAKAIDQAVAGHFTWIVFRSAHGVTFFHTALKERALPAEVRIAAQGEHTARAVRKALSRESVVPVLHTSEGLVDLLKSQVVQHDTILLPGAREHRQVIAPLVRTFVREVIDLALYETVHVPVAEAVCGVIASSAPNQTIFISLSPSAVRGVAASLPSDYLHRAHHLAIGPVTGAALREMGYAHISSCERPAVEAIIERLVSLRDSVTTAALRDFY